MKKKLRLYCLVDRSLICSVCCFGSPKGHEVLPVTDTTDQLRDEVHEALDSITLLREESASELEACQRRIVELQDKLGRFDASSDLLARCLKEKNASAFLLSWVEAVRLSYFNSTHHPPSLITP